MAIPKFGFLKIETLACILMVAAGVAGLLLVLTGSSDWILGALGKKWTSAHVKSFWLVLQSLAVIVGGIGAWRSNSFVAAAVGVASSLIAETAVGHISFFPGLLLLFLIVNRFRAFNIFLPRWRGQGPPPPGAWRV
jgi:hypothetical protein